MAWSINKAFVLGNVTRDPEMRYTPNGQGVTSFGVATNRRWKDASGAVQEETQFHDVVAWGKLAEAITQILKKGTKVAVIGRLQTSHWDAPDGSKRSRTEIIMDEFVPLTPRGTAGEPIPTADVGVEETGPNERPNDAPENGKKTSQKPTNAGDEKPDKTTDDEINLDDIPF